MSTETTEVDATKKAAESAEKVTEKTVADAEIEEAVADDEDDATTTSALALNEDSSGEYEYTVEVTDVAGKTASVATVKANIDKKLPTITLDTDLSGA